MGELQAAPSPCLKASSFIDTRVVYCSDNPEQIKKLPDACVDLNYRDPPFNPNQTTMSSEPLRRVWLRMSVARAACDRRFYGQDVLGDFRKTSTK